jgi:CRISPR-associated endonuclease/helicase Cas3
MENLSLAKSNPRQTIEEHTADVVVCFRSLRQLYPNAFSKELWEAIEITIEGHDLGKINSRFQNRIYKQLGIKVKLDDGMDSLYQENHLEQIPHGVLSTTFIDYKRLEDKYEKLIAKSILLAIACHHERDGLIDVIKSKGRLIGKIITDDLSQWNVRNTNNSSFLLEKPNVFSYLKIPWKITSETLKELDNETFWLSFAVIKGLLNRSDYGASGGLKSIEFAPLQDGKSVAQMVKDKLPKLRDVQQYMLDRQGKNLLVVAATGIGKTEASLLWNGGRKLFYTLPLRVSINAIYERIKGKVKDGEMVGYGYAKAELLHSDALSYYIKEKDSDNDPFIRHQQARLFASPLTVCTIDQLFKFVFKCNGYEAMFATLAYSNVIIDEMQMYSPQILACILYGLRLITKAGGNFAIVTATFPKILLDFFERLEIPVVIPERMFQRTDLGTRHKIKFVDADFDLSRILSAGQTKKVLVIVNTVKEAQKLYQDLQPLSMETPVKLLHGHFIVRDRNFLEKEIMNFAPGKFEARTNHDCGIWIATQIVEASLDIDFDILFTEMSIADSLLQRMGRCYRQRMYSGLEPNVIVFNSGSGIGKVYDTDLYQLSVNALLQIFNKYPNQFFTEDMKQEYIDLVYSPDLNPDILKTNYYKEISKTIVKLQNIRPFSFKKEDIDRDFRGINNVTLIPEKIYNQLERQGKIEEWKAIFTNKAATKEIRVKTIAAIREYTVSIRYYAKLNYDRATELFFPGSGLYRTPLKYDFDQENYGLGLLIDQVENDNFSWGD